MLAMDVHQLLAQLTQSGDGAGVAIDLRARAAVLFDDAAQQQLARIAGQVVFGQPGSQRVINAEERRDVGPLGPLAYQRRVTAPAQH